MACTGGQGTEPYEQKTQHVPGFGRSRTPQVAHWYTTMQASVGIVSRRAAPQAGQVSVDSRVI